MTQHHPFCPHCGYDLARDAPILINDFSMMASGQPLFYRAQRIKLRHAETVICWALMKAFPQAVSTSVLIERIGSEDAEDPEGLIRVYICRIRKALREVNAPESILTLAGYHSYCWTTGGTFNEKVAQALEA